MSHIKGKHSRALHDKATKEFFEHQAKRFHMDNQSLDLYLEG